MGIGGWSNAADVFADPELGFWADRIPLVQNPRTSAETRTGR